MFNIKYLILEDERDRILSIVDIKEFEADMDTIVGQIELIFTEHRIGFVNIDVPYDGEFIVLWLRLLNEAIIYLSKYDFAAICEPSSDSDWIEFNLVESEIFVKLVKSNNKQILLSRIEKIPNTKSEILWIDKIEKDEFYNVIQNVTLKFLNEIKALNPLIQDSKDIKALIEINKMAKQILLSDNE